MMRTAPGAFRVVAMLSLPFSVSPREGARTSVHLATSPEVRGVSGRYFTRSKPARTSNRFDTAENRALLWKLSQEAVGGGPSADREAV